MASMLQSKFSNGLLRSLEQSDHDLLAPNLHPVKLNLRQRLEQANRRIRAIYFIESGLASVVATSTSGRRQVEVGIVGREGTTGAAAILGLDRSPNDTFVQLEGSAHCVMVPHLRHAMHKSKTLTSLLLRYAHVCAITAAHTALANATGKIEERLARRLLMAHDRSPGDDIHLTHEFLSLMLATRRASVTTALNEFDARGLIGHTRGCITILDRHGLQVMAGGLYGVPEAEYARVLQSSKR